MASKFIKTWTFFRFQEKFFDFWIIFNTFLIIICKVKHFLCILCIFMHDYLFMRKAQFYFFSLWQGSSPRQLRACKSVPYLFQAQVYEDLQQLVYILLKLDTNIWIPGKSILYVFKRFTLIVISDRDYRMSY